MPPPGTLQAYEQMLPGAAERMMAMAEREQAHRHQLRTQEQHFQRTWLAERARGQWLSFFLAVLCVGAAIYFFHKGNHAAGIALSGLLLSGVIVSLVTRTNAAERNP